MMKEFSLYFLVLLSVACKKGVASGDIKVADATEENYKFRKVVFDPEKAGFIKDSVIVLNNDSIEVVYEYTDYVAHVMPTEDIYGNKGVNNSRDLLFHLVNKRTNDTITLRKEMFRKYNYNDDFDELIMQSAAYNLQSETGVIPFVISLCKPDSDICDNYGITIVNGKAVIEEVDLGEMGE